ncbi:hypothetical protein LEP3755_19130 [Leptolyngbya sp. NIES-3755]|nr:hypothetical protein LEP3755_19130 [Leptolyngbya sp. NIES-3755]
MKCSRRVAIAIVLCLCGIGSYIPVRLAIAKHSFPNPKLILVVGGTPDRERKAAQLAQNHPNLEILISSGTSEAAQIFDEAGIAKSRLHFDNRATDTVTNFTTAIEFLKQRDIHHVYVVTSDFHLARSTAIANIVFGSQGVTYTPVAAYNPFYPPEPKLRTLRDVGRAILWLGTGRTGAVLKR